MPYSPIPKFPEIIDELKAQGLEKQVPRPMLENAIAKVTGAIKSNTQGTTIEWMVRLNYLKIVNTRLFEIIDNSRPPKQKKKKEGDG